MGTNCTICSGDFETSKDNIILCNHHESVVHKDCCINNCSGDNKPCIHGVAEFQKK